MSFKLMVRWCRSRVLEPADKCRLMCQPQQQQPQQLSMFATTTTTIRTRVADRSLSLSSLSSSPPQSETSLSGKTTDETVNDKEGGDVLNKKDLAKILSQKHGITATMANNILTTVFGTMAECVADGKAVKIVRFGTLELQPCKARMARNPKTNDIVHVPKMDRIRFRPSDFFKGLLNRPKTPPS